MELVEIPTELTTAATDAVLSVMAILVVMYLHSLRNRDQFRTAIWIGIFSLLALAAALGTVAHVPNHAIVSLESPKFVFGVAGSIVRSGCCA